MNPQATTGKANHSYLHFTLIGASIAEAIAIGPSTFTDSDQNFRGLSKQGDQD